MFHHAQWDDLQDIWFAIIFVVSLWCAWGLLMKHRKNSDTWNVKTGDYWYALFMWSMVGVISSAQGIILDRPITPAYVATTAAVLVTGKGLHRKGSWGGDS